MYKILGADQKEYGPVSADQVRQWIVERRLNAQSLVRADGANEWQPLALCPEFSATLATVVGVSAVAPGPAPVRAGPATNPMAVAGLVMGIVTVAFGWCCCYGFPFNILGIVFSVIALRQIKANPDTQAGRGLAIAGLVLSILGMAIALVFVLIFGAVSIFQEFFKN